MVTHVGMPAEVASESEAGGYVADLQQSLKSELELTAKLTAEIVKVKDKLDKEKKAAGLLKANLDSYRNDVGRALVDAAIDADIKHELLEMLGLESFLYKEAVFEVTVSFNAAGEYGPVADELQELLVEYIHQGLTKHDFAEEIEYLDTSVVES